ncbi:penicillin-binding protein 2, partial [Streptomyces sp. WAC08241]
MPGDSAWSSRRGPGEGRPRCGHPATPGNPGPARPRRPAPVPPPPPRSAPRTRTTRPGDPAEETHVTPRRGGLRSSGPPLRGVTW